MPSPQPLYSFTIPSIHDDTVLDCRIYHSPALSDPKAREAGSSTQWRGKGIVMAHPYAPMGGSYDDRVVGIVVEEFLALGFVVGTFNFRGAHGSKSRTSWSGKPEVDDYTSFAAFFMHYISYLHPFPSPSTVFTPDASPISPVATQLQPQRSLPLQEPPLVILGGYSYGSLILRHLPPVPSIISPFSAPVPGTAASEILLRAHRLADSSNLAWINSARDHARPRRKRGSLNVAMGGEETSPEKRRSSRDIRRQSVDREGGRLSIDLGSRIRSLSHRRSFRKGERPRTPPVSNEMHANGVESAILMPEVRYLLISPLTPPISTVVAPGLGPRFWSKEKEGREVVGKHTTLAVLGDQDIFSSAKRSREWAERMGGKPGSRFEYVEVAGAGHFWHEIGVEEKLRNALKGWEGGVG